MKLPIILASSSRYRKMLLEKLQLPFKTFSPNIDEKAKINELPCHLVKRLARLKALATANYHDKCLIIASDQVAAFNNSIIGKPHTRSNAIAQLQAFNGNKITFYTGLCVYNTVTNNLLCEMESFTVFFRQLTLDEITYYVDKEQPFDCAGSFKSEGLGITLFDKLEGRDPNTLIGLPLILLCELLKKQGVNILAK